MELIKETNATLPNQTKEEKKKPSFAQKPKKEPNEKTSEKTNDNIVKDSRIVPDKTEDQKAMTRKINSQNMIIVNGKEIEIKPTRMRYFRNRTASIYTILKKLPLYEFLSYDKGVFDETKDSDQLLYDFMVAVFDDEAFVRKEYDNFDAENFEQILKIFGRINHIDQREEAARKNLETQMATKQH